ncbi:putative bifunctional diguanylate cyclase/phosphodiesterase [Murimonas intestini]|uniref:Diguanylate cyclase (GGDEF)-like protein n=1 Tax=Murimonas intestini TaxID=1337051 RepID=A0AB73T153_9FIRM|nr:GGDEF domain-containing phosphodiesterase [Murimonas intestini]MCR1840447.1 EAL domain-containing protein [Murimonas intestini]MCR1867442.1 EAL domain-containing protein [Murimonas intestini]MCR1884629.1 EAL domain-containing protein [Murimonas intestini]
MTWNIAPELISLVILGIIWIYSRKGSHLPSLKNRMFQGCLMVTFCAMLSNVLSTLMIYNTDTVPLLLTWIVTQIYFILTPLMGMAYFLYTVSVIYADSPSLKKIIWTGITPGCLYAVMVLLNPVTRNIFDLTEANGYTRGHLIFVTYLIFYAYCVASIIVTLCNHKKIEKEIYRILAAFPLLAVLVIIIQQIYSDIILSGSAATCALLIIYLHLQNKQISMDYLTNLPNRQELLNMLHLLTNKYPVRGFTLLVVSLRDFRQVNNACGQQSGDAFLKSVGHFLSTIGPAGNVYRFSGDEFALLFTQENSDELDSCVSAIRERMALPWQINDYRFLIRAVMGIIRSADCDGSIENTIGGIEYAVSQAKSGKYGRVCYCDKEMLEKRERKHKVIRILKDKLADKSFEMYYQPIYSIETGKFQYAESLMRINDTPIGPIYPSEFIPVAEETGLIIEITYVILDKVCKFINRLRDLGIQIDSIHVNFSAIQFSQQDLSKKVLEIIESNNTPMPAVKIEFTESTLAENPTVVAEFAEEMKSYGIMMGLDDFGTGYSNIATVINIPFGTLKLDRSLVQASIKNPTSALAVKNLVRAFKDLNMKVVAEGVETEEQRQLVEEFGVDQIQGFYYSKPLSETEMAEFMRNH